MVTIKELALEAGVSPSTVSIVLGGKADERKISKETQQRVINIAFQKGYQPNMSARRLRMRALGAMVLAVFWASDFRAPMMVRFLRGLQKAVLGCGRQCEIIFHTYDNNKLEQSIKVIGACDAAIICNASETDMRFLNKSKFAIPVVLYNRQSQKYCTVNVDDARMGAMVAEIFAARGHETAVLLTADSVFPGMELRNDSFVNVAREKGLNVLRFHQENSMAGGYRGGLAIASIRPQPDCLFCISDAMAIGALRAFREQNVCVPETLELISIGNGDKELEEYASVSLSVVHLPMEDMAVACFNMVLNLIDNSVQVPYSVELPITYLQRESCGGERKKQDDPSF